MVSLITVGTEVLSSKDGTLVGLLGASPGASVSPQIALEVINKFDKGANSAFHERRLTS